MRLSFVLEAIVRLPQPGEVGLLVLQEEPGLRVVAGLLRLQALVTFALLAACHIHFLLESLHELPKEATLPQPKYALARRILLVPGV